MSNNDQTPTAFNTAVLLDDYDLSFDPADKLNGSLYVCVPRGSAAPEAVITHLRTAGLWSTETRQVGDDQRQAYKDGLEFVAAIAFNSDPQPFVLARFDHPKFPSDAGRFDAWLDCLDSTHERL